MQKENADEKARRVRLLRIWTDICAMAMCEMPEGRSENRIDCRMLSNAHGTSFLVNRMYQGCSVSIGVADTSQFDAEEKLADIQRRLKPYVA